MKKQCPEYLYRADRRGVEAHKVIGKSGKYYITDTIKGRDVLIVEKSDTNPKDGDFGYYTRRDKAIEAEIRVREQYIEEAKQVVEDLNKLLK